MMAVTGQQLRMNSEGLWSRIDRLIGPDTFCMHEIGLVQQRQRVFCDDSDYGGFRVRQLPIMEDLDGES